MENTLSSLFSALFDMVVPPRASERVVRTFTVEKLQRLQSALLRQGYMGLEYQDPRIKALVWELKYHANRRAAHLAGAILAEELLALAADEIGKPLLIPVPMHATRRRERGHNQTELLCEASLRYLNEAEVLEYAPNILQRVRATPPQQGLPRHVRLRNIHGSMRVAGPDVGRIVGRTCIVVDDVSTTGATFAEANRALRAAGAARVECVALAYS